jgi:hypothetical protein
VNAGLAISAFSLLLFYGLLKLLVTFIFGLDNIFLGDIQPA